jgi:hypothetical protein
MMSDEISEQDDVLLPDAQVCRRYGGKSAMWIWRRVGMVQGFRQPFGLDEESTGDSVS